MVRIQSSNGISFKKLKIDTLLSCSLQSDYSMCGLETKCTPAFVIVKEGVAEGENIKKEWTAAQKPTSLTTIRKNRPFGVR